MVCFTPESLIFVISLFIHRDTPVHFWSCQQQLTCQKYTQNNEHEHGLVCRCVKYNYSVPRAYLSKSKPCNHVSFKSWFKSNRGPLQYVIFLSISTCLLSLATAINQSETSMLYKQSLKKSLPCAYVVHGAQAKVVLLLAGDKQTWLITTTPGLFCLHSTTRAMDH